MTVNRFVVFTFCIVLLLTFALGVGTNIALGTDTTETRWINPAQELPPDDKPIIGLYGEKGSRVAIMVVYLRNYDQERYKKYDAWIAVDGSDEAQEIGAPILWTAIP